jgi:hypothetical protein
MVMNDELERDWKEAAVACVKIIFRNLSGDTEKYHKETLARTVCVRAKVRELKSLTLPLD